MGEHLPQRIDREALERVIVRAAELQTGEHEVGDGLTWDEIRQLGRDVGIPERFLQQALLEEQNRSPAAPARGLANRMVGPETVSAERVVRGAVEDVEQALLRWIDEQELLTVQRHQPGRVDWEPLPGLQAAFKQTSAALALSGGRRAFMMAKASLLSATTTELEPGYCHVSLTARLRSERNIRIGSSVALVAGGAFGTALLGFAGALALLVPLPIVGGAVLAGLVSRGYRPHLERTHLGLERALDHLERGTVKPDHRLPPSSTGGTESTVSSSIIETVSREIRKALKP